MSQGLLSVLPVLTEQKSGWPWNEETSTDLYQHRKNWPKISIITPSFNQGIFLEETLRSILLQNYPNLELIVIDGGSKDESVNIIEKYAPWITYWVSEKDNGQSDALNKGFRKINGDIVTWLNSDDLFTKGTLVRIAELFSELPDDVGVIYGGTTKFEGDKILDDDYGYDDPCIERFISGQAFSQPSAFFKSKYLNEAGCWVREDLNLGMDYDLFARLGCVCKFHRVKEMYSLYRLHDSSKTITMHARLVEDWTRTFSNLSRQLGWNEIIEKMETISCTSGFMNYTYQLPFKEKKEISGNLDKEKALFFHLCYWLKSLYWYDRHEEARALLKYIKKNYPDHWIRKEKDVPPILFKLGMHPIALKILKKIKNLA